MKNLFTAIGTKIQIGIVNTQNTKEYYASQIQDVLPNGDILIACPISAGYKIKLTIASRIHLILSDDQKIEYSYKAYAIVKEQHLEKDITLYRIQLQENIEYSQRRSSFRVNFEPYENDILIQSTSSSPTILNLLNLSEFGAKLQTNVLYKMNEVMQFRVFVQPNYSIYLQGKVIYTSPSNQTHQFNMGLRFLNLNLAKRDLIVKFLFSEQRKQLYARKMI